MGSLRGLCILSTSLLCSAACGPEMDDGHPRRYDMGEAPHASAPKDLSSDDTTCGGQQFQVDRVQPNVFLVIDRSGSMNNPTQNGGSKKWDDMKAALGSLVASYDNQIRLGLSLYNRDGDCAAGLIDSSLAPMNGTKVMGQINATSPGGNTPTAATLAYVKTAAGLSDPTRPNVVVLATDGLPNCGDTDVAGKIGALYSMSPPVKTFVIGLGTETNSNPALLDSWAVAGHTERAGATKYYQSNSSAELMSAFQTIVSGIVSCTFTLSSAPPDPGQLYVWLGGAAVPMDGVNGWSYYDGPPSVTLNGASCDQLKADPAKKLQIVYGCPLPPPVL